MTLSKPWSQYQQVVVETFRANGRIRARPIAGECYPTTMFVECSRDMRNRHPVGTRFRIHAMETSKEDGTPFLYTHYSWRYEVVGR